MYNEHFGLKERPFKSVPDPDFFYNGIREKEVLDRVRLYLDDPSVSLFVLTGEVGAGKTLLLKVLSRDLSNVFRVVSLTYSGDEPVHYVRVLVSEIGGNPEGLTDLSSARDALVTLLEGLEDNSRLLLCIDEAQNLPFRAMSELLSSLDHPRVKIILAGLYGLRGNVRLASRGLERMEAYDSCHLGPFSDEEGPSYITHRLSLSGGEFEKLFGQNTLPEVLKVSKGIPRLINKICDLALLNAYFIEKKQVTLGIVKDVTAEILESKDEIPELTPFPALPKPGATDVVPYPASLTGTFVPPAAEAGGAPGALGEEVASRNILAAGVEARRRVRDTLHGLWQMGLTAKDIFDLFADSMKEDLDEVHTGAALAGPASGRAIALHPRLSVLLMERNPRMRMHLENRCTELEFNPLVIRTTEELAQGVSQAPVSDLQILVVDFDWFSGEPSGTEEALSQLGTIRYNFPHLPVIVTSVLPLMAIRSRLLYLDMPYLLHKPDMSRVNLSDIRREFGKFFYELYRCISSIHSHTEAIVLKAYAEALGLALPSRNPRSRTESRREA